MRRALWIGAAAAVAVAAAVPLWLVIDDGGVRRLGSIDPTTVQGQVGRLTLAGVNGGVPVPIDSFVFRVGRPVGATQPEVDSIDVTLPIGTSMTQLVGRAIQGTKAASAKVELVKSIGGTPTVYLTFDLTGVTVDGFDDSYSVFSSGDLQDGTEKIALRYDAVTMTCITSACTEPTHTQGSGTELAVPDIGALAVRPQAGDFAVPKNFKGMTSIPATVRMGLNYLLPALFSRAREGKVFEKTVQVDLARPVDNTPRKTATYKFGGAVVTSLAIAGTSSDVPLVEIELSSRRVGVTAYTYLDSGALDKSSTFCWDVDKSSSSCTGL